MLHRMTLDALPLAGGGTLRDARIAWAQYGPPPDRARRVWLVLHGITSSHQAFADDPPVAPDNGWLQAWADNGVFDLARDCVLAPNTLGSCYGTSGPASGPVPGGPPDAFPDIVIADALALYARWLARMPVARIDAVLGYSYGGYQAFAWALNPPVPTSRVIVLASAPKGGGSLADAAALRALAGRWELGDPQARKEWLDMRVATLQRYGVADWLKDSGQDASPPALRRLAETWAAGYPPRTLAALRQAAAQFDVSQALCERGPRMPLLWMVNQGDRLFPSLNLPGPAPAVMTGIVVDGRYGHASPTLEAPLWTPHVRAFMTAGATSSPHPRPPAP